MQCGYSIVIILKYVNALHFNFTEKDRFLHAVNVDSSDRASKDLSLKQINCLTVW